MFIEMAMSDLGDYLQREMTQRGLSLRQAAVTVSLPYATFYGVVKGSVVPTLPTLQKIAAGLGVSLRRLQELAGFVFEEMEPKADPLYGLTDEQRDFLRRLSPEQKAAVIDLARRMLGQQ